MLVFEHLRATLQSLVRERMFSVMTVITPSVIFIFIGSTADTAIEANSIMGSFCIFATLGVFFFLFGVGIANDRESSWERFLRVLPVGPATRFAATVMTALVFAIAAVSVLIAVALTITDAGLPLHAWGRLFIAVFAGSVPMALFGITIGYWMPAKAALPAANILYLVLAFGGGLFIPPHELPEFLNTFSVVLPTRHIGELAWASVLDQPWPGASWVWLAGYTIAFGLLAAVGYRRDEGTRYS